MRGVHLCTMVLLQWIFIMVIEWGHSMIVVWGILQSWRRQTGVRSGDMGV
jgi:hypothetical protein